MAIHIDMLGTPEIPEEKRPELARRLMEIFRRGGMLQLEDVDMFGKRVTLLRPLEMEDERVAFCYNYLADDWEDYCGYDAKNDHLWNNGVGLRQFNGVMAAAYLQMELMSDTPCFYMACGSRMYPTDTAAWLNHLFAEQYDLAHRRNLPLVIDALHQWSIDQGRKGGEIQKSELVGMLPDGELDGDNAEPISPVSTSEFLEISPNDMLYYWPTDGDILPTATCMAWFRSLSERFDVLMAEEVELLAGQDFLQRMLEDLDKAYRHFGYIYAFKDMFFEFLSCAGERRYQVWWTMFREIMSSNWSAMPTISDTRDFKSDYWKRGNPARMEVKRYLALLANKELRETVLKFDIPALPLKYRMD